ncbi:Carboxylesterase [Operophtera brumata]|uniref:Carboxylesterase n=1 Tax=Operophtera brumata TaxID=104452 RepID=A0A0L7LQY5_OPEBR|nr:Carboxylesterase [Operophtera brumata]
MGKSTTALRNPEPSEPWTGVLDATKPGSKCIQSNPYSSTPIDGSEDCLYLNIYTPVLPSEKIANLPVFFFVHGGRLIFGFGNYYTPDYLIKHDVVLVTVNYRLHILGWLCLNMPECPGNMGLKDTVMALRWVNKNVCYFNGDRRNITVFGESAGGAIVTSFMTSDMTIGLYSKVIAQSGNCIADLYLVEEDSIEKARYVASLMGKELTDEREIYEFFSAAPIEDLIIGFTTAELSRPSSVINAYFLPVVERKFDGVERFFAEHPRTSIRENRFHKVPVLSCLNSHEGALFFRDENGNVRYEDDFYYFIPRYAFVDRNTRKAMKYQSEIRQFYLQDKKLDDAVKNEYLNMVSDGLFIRDIMLFVEMISRYSDQTYSLKFSYTGSMNTRVMKSIGVKGATHGDMIQYQFYRRSKAKQCNENDLKNTNMDESKNKMAAIHKR